MARLVVRRSLIVVVVLWQRLWKHGIICGVVLVLKSWWIGLDVLRLLALGCRSRVEVPSWHLVSVRSAVPIRMLRCISIRVRELTILLTLAVPSRGLVNACPSYRLNVLWLATDMRSGDGLPFCGLRTTNFGLGLGLLTGRVYSLSRPLWES